MHRCMSEGVKAVSYKLEISKAIVANHWWGLKASKSDRLIYFLITEQAIIQEPVMDKCCRVCQEPVGARLAQHGPEVPDVVQHETLIM